MTVAYLVHSCSEEDYCQEGCDGLAVFANSSVSALEMAGSLTQEPSVAEAKTDDRLEVLRGLWEGDPLSPWSPKPDAARLWRTAGWGEPGTRCSECLLGQWDNLPESTLCECGYCGECGCDEGCERPA